MSMRTAVLFGGFVASAIVAFLLVTYVFVEARNSKDGERFTSDSSLASFDSLETAVLVPDAVAVVEITSQPEERLYTSASVTNTMMDQSAQVNEVLKGTIDAVFTVTQTQESRTVFPSGDEIVDLEEGYIPLDEGREYVLFLTEAVTGRWTFAAWPIGFEITSEGNLRALGEGIYSIEPETWGVSSLDQLKDQIQQILSGPTLTPSITGQPTYETGTSEPAYTPTPALASTAVSTATEQALPEN